MKTKILFILFSFLPFLGFSQLNTNEFKWEGKRDSKNFNISYLEDQYSTFYYLMNSYIKITDKTKQKPTIVKCDDADVFKISDSVYRIRPNKIGKDKYLIINNDSLHYDIEEIPASKFSIKFSQSKSPFSDCIDINDFFKSNSLEVSFNSEKYNITHFVMYFAGVKSGESFGLSGNCSEEFDDKFKKIFKENIFEKSIIYIRNVKIQLPYDKEISLPPTEVKVIDNYNNEFIRRTVSFKPYTYDLNLMKINLRIKITGHPRKGDIKIISDLADELNGILETIKVKIVDRQPSLTIIFDTIKNDSFYIKSGCRSIDGGYLIGEHPHLFYPFNIRFVMLIDTNKESSRSLRYNIVNLLGEFKNNNVDGSIFNSSIFNYNDKLSSYDKYMLKTLYSYDGEYKTEKIIDNNFDPPDRNALFFIMLIFSVCLLFIFSEIYNYYGFNFLVGKIRSKIIRRIIEAILIAQIPSIAVLILLIGKFSIGDFHEIGFCYVLEKYFVPFSILVGVLFLGLDYLLNKIKKNWIVITLNFFLSFFCIWLAYQIIYLFITPEFVYLPNVGWKIMLIPFLITLYRLYAHFQTNKISGLLQEKELELTKQKELKFKSDLNALQARINPHFLYNALNSLASLAYIDAGKTEKMALSLSKLFRYNINKEDEHYSLLKDEIEMTEIYLEIEKNRFEDKLEYNIEVQNLLYEFRIPKFILQPLAENAVKHGVSKIVEKGIIGIKIFEQGQKVFIEIYDNGPEFPGGLISGYGLQNTYEKLKLLYKKPFEIEFINKPEKKLVIMLTK